ncbi:hypothetical protein D3C86_2037720 [compost metagenome]
MDPILTFGVAEARSTHANRLAGLVLSAIEYYDLAVFDGRSGIECIIRLPIDMPFFHWAKEMRGAVGGYHGIHAGWSFETTESPVG